MPSEIIKVSKNDDLYLEWSTIVDAPTFVGTRVEMRQYLTRPQRCSYLPRAREVEARMARADITGSSGRWPGACKWDKDYLMFEQEGMLPRLRLLEYAKRLQEDVNAQPTGLLEPFDDED